MQCAATGGPTRSAQRHPGLPRRDGPAMTAWPRSATAGSPTSCALPRTSPPRSCPRSRRASRPRAGPAPRSWCRPVLLGRRRSGRSPARRPPAWSASTPACAPTPTCSPSTTWPTSRGRASRRSAAGRGAGGAGRRRRRPRWSTAHPHRHPDQVAERIAAYGGLADAMKLTRPRTGCRRRIRALRSDPATHRGAEPVRPLEDIRIVAVEQYGGGPVRLPSPRRPRRRDDQDRGPTRRRRRRPLRAALRRGRGLALLRDVQPQQAQPLARPVDRRRAARCSRTWSRVSDAVYSNLRGDVPGEAAASATTTSAPSTRAIVCCSSDRLRHDRAARRPSPATTTSCRGSPAGWTSPASPTARRRSAACPSWTTAAGSSRRSRCSPRSTPPAATASAWTATSACSTPRCRMLTYPATWHLNERLRARRARATRRTRRWCRSRTSRPPTGGSSSAAPKEKFWRRLAEVLGRPDAAPTTRASRRSRGRARSTRRAARAARAASSRRGPSAEWLAAAGAGRRPVRAGQRRRRGARRPAHRRARHGRGDRRTRTSARSASSRSPVRVGAEPRRATARAPRRNEDAATCCATCSATTTPGSATSPPPAPSEPGPHDGRRRPRPVGPGRRPRGPAASTWPCGTCSTGAAPPSRHCVPVPPNLRWPSRGGSAGRRRPGFRHRHRLGAPAAALASGVLVHALDFDDTHAGGLVHATAPVLPVVLAVGEQLRVTGAEAVTALAAGLETVCRLGAAAPHAFHARGVHATAACGVLAAAAHRGPAAPPHPRADRRRARHRRQPGRGAPGVPAHRVVDEAAAHRVRRAPRHPRRPPRRRGRQRPAPAPSRARPGSTRRSPAGGVPAGRGPRRARRAVRAHPDHGEAVPGVPAAARAARRRRDPAPRPRRNRDVLVDVHPDAEAIVCGPGPGRAPHRVSGEVRAWPGASRRCCSTARSPVATFTDVDRPDIACPRRGGTAPRGAVARRRR